MENHDDDDDDIHGMEENHDVVDHGMGNHERVVHGVEIHDDVAVYGGAKNGEVGLAELTLIVHQGNNDDFHSLVTVRMLMVNL